MALFYVYKKARDGVNFQKYCIADISRYVIEYIFLFSIFVQ